MNIEIKTWLTNKVLFALDCENNTVKLTLEAGVKVGAYLQGADLQGASLQGADFQGADLQGANLRGASVRDVSVKGAGKLIGDRPIVQIGPLGSRGAYLMAFLTDSGIRIRTGCFFGTLEKFEAAVEEEHGGNIHGVEYRAALTLIRVHAEIWVDKKTTEAAA